jgi:hypothetical protein
LVKLFVVFGLALLVGGAYAIVDGWPYRVLERGFTEVILGAISFAAGLLILAAAAILAEIRRLKTLMASAVTAVSLNAVRHEERAPAPIPAPNAPRDEVRPPEPALGGAAIAAGAGAIALGGVLAGLSKPEPPAGDEEKAGPAAAAFAPAEEDEPVPAVEPAQSKSFAGHDDWLLPPAPLREATPEGGSETVGKTEPDFFEAALLPTPAQEVLQGADEKPANPADEFEPAGDQASENQTELALETETLEAEAEADEPEPEIEAKTDAPAAQAEPIWWPQVERASDEAGPKTKPASDYDDFSALREQLTDALAAPGKAPEIDPPRRSLDTVSDWMAPRPWPPVTQPRSSDALDALEEPVAVADEAPLPIEEPARAVQEAAEEALPPVPPAGDEPAAAVEPEGHAAEPEPELVPEVEEPAAPEAVAPGSEADKPSASDEGIVGAYQVGETHFTIYADGSIQARTPDGDYAFGSMDELKAYLASEKSRLETGPG